MILPLINFTFAGISFATTLPAAMRAFCPMVTPGSMVAFAPILTPFLMMTDSSLKFLFLDFGYLSLQKLTFGPIKTLSYMRTPSHNCTPHFMVTLSPIMTSFSMKQCEQILQFAPIRAFGSTTQYCQMLVFSPICLLCTSDSG